MDATLTKDGKLSYPNPPKSILTLSIGPFVLCDFVEYFKTLVSVEAYDNFSGTSGRAILKLVYDAPTTGGTLNIDYSPL